MKNTIKLFSIIALVAVIGFGVIALSLAGCDNANGNTTTPTPNPSPNPNPNPTHTHTLSKTTAVAATCSAAGNPDYWTCAECGKYFSDENGTTELTAAQIVIAQLPHTFTQWSGDTATFDKAGVETETCSVCGATGTNTQPTSAWGTAGLYGKALASITRTDEPIDISSETGANDVEKAIAYAKANAAADKFFLLAIDDDYNVGTQTLNAADMNLTIIGIGAERSLQYNGLADSRMFNIDNGTSLTLENNITLKGHTNATSWLIFVAYSGILTMKEGSKITDHTTNSNVGAVYVQIGALLQMEGGEISGNSTSDTRGNASGGVFFSGGIITMSGGKITGNTAPSARPSDVYCMADAQFSLSGTAEIGYITLGAAPFDDASIMLGSTYTPANKSTINLYSEAATLAITIVRWVNKAVLKKDSGSITAADVAKFNLGHFIGTDNVQSIDQDHEINATGVLVAK